MTTVGHSPTPWGLCYHLRSKEHDEACKCGYRGSIWDAAGEYIVCEMGSSPDHDATGMVQGHVQPQADRPTQLADAALIVKAVNSHAALVEALSTVYAYAAPFRDDSFGTLDCIARAAGKALKALAEASEPTEVA